MIVGWRSPLNGRVYPVDDYASLAGAIPEPLLRALAAKAKGDTRHQGPGVTITGGLSCPRKTFIARALPCAPDPSKMWTAQRGTWLHEQIGLSLGQNPEWWTEETAADKCVYHGTLFGIPMSCKVDALRTDYSALWDWKFRKDGAERFVDPGGEASAGDKAQLNMARMLIEQTTGKDLSDMEMTVWVMAGGIVRTTCPLMSEYEVGAVRPGGGKLTVEEVFHALYKAMQRWEASENVTLIAKSLPLAGLEMYVKRDKRTQQVLGNMCTSYCEFSEECAQVEHSQ